MTAQEAHDLLNRFYHRDRDPLMSRMGSGYRCHTPGDNPIAGTHLGPEGMLAHIARMQALSGQTFRPHHQDTFVTDGRWAVVPVHLHAQREGRTLDQPAFGIWKFDEQGQVTDHWECPTDMPAFDAFWR